MNAVPVKPLKIVLPAQTKPAERTAQRISPTQFRVMFEDSKEPYPLTFRTWRAAFAFGKNAGKAFGVYMRQYRVAAWHPKDGFYSFVAPELILQTEHYEQRKRDKDNKYN